MPAPPHYHQVLRPGKDPTSLPCYFGYLKCPYAAATPEELGIWLESQERTMPFEAWLKNHRAQPTVPAESGILVDQSVSDAVLRAAVEKLTDENGVTTPVPFVKYNSDGSSTTVGHAVLKIDDGGISADIVIDAELLIGKKLTLGLRAGDVSIGES